MLKKSSSIGDYWAEIVVQNPEHNTVKIRRCNCGRKNLFLFGIILKAIS
jgi:hypothetical protein